jgi:hypothetical protein
VVIAQDRASSEPFGMPGSAIATGAVSHVLPLAEIAPMLVSLVTTGRPPHAEGDDGDPRPGGSAPDPPGAPDALAIS